MYAIINGTNYALSDVYTGDNIELTFSATPIADVDAIAANVPSQIAVYTDAGNLIYSFIGYTVATEISKIPSSDTVKLSLRQPYESEIQVAALSAQVAAMGTSYPDTIDGAKAKRIDESKSALAAYLAEHPLTWTDGKQYSVTEDKQTLLNNALAVYQLATAAGQEAMLTWNATGEECTVWAYEDLCALALGIASYVKPLVARQQAIEVSIRAAETEDEVSAVVIDYAAE